MAEEQQEQDRSEAPSHFKLARARRKGAVARGADLGFMASLAAFTLYLWLRGPAVGTAVEDVMTRSLVNAAAVQDSASAMMALIGGLLVEVERSLIFLVVTVFCVVLVVELIQIGGFVFSAEPLKFNLGRLNPAQNLKRIFSKRMLVETAKNIVKLLAYAAIAGVAILGVRRTLPLAANDARGLAIALSSFSVRLLLMFVGAAIVFAVLDQLIVRRDFLQRMRMSRRELRREHRDREGEPRMKQRRKQLHAEFTKLSKSLRNIRSADLVVTNPTHYAVALRYRPGVTDAPVVVSRGANHLALRLKRMAFVYGVTIVEDRPLAQILYFRCELDQEIPQLAFQRVADHYLALRRRRSLQQPDAAHV